MSSKKVEIHTFGGRDIPSRLYTPVDNNFYSAYTGNSIASQPTYSTPTDDPTGNHKYYKTCIKIPGSTKKMCH